MLVPACRKDRLPDMSRCGARFLECHSAAASGFDATMKPVDCLFPIALHSFVGAMAL